MKVTLIAYQQINVFAIVDSTYQSFFFFNPLSIVSILNSGMELGRQWINSNSSLE